MFRSINSKFYAIAILLFISFSIGYGILAYFLHQQNQSAILAREVIVFERDFNKLNKLFHEARFWEKVILSQKNPEADMRFGSLIEQIRGLLVALNKEKLNAATKTTLSQVIENINRYENNFNILIQLKTKQRLISTRMETNYRSMVSIILSSNNPLLLKPLFNFTHFLITYRSGRDSSKYQALKLVINSVDKKFESLKISDVRMKGYLQSFKSLLDKDFKMEQEIFSINSEVERINTTLKRLFTNISLASELLLKNKFQETADIREELKMIFLVSAILGIMIILIVILLISKNIIAPIRSVALVMQDVKAGDIGARFKNKTEKNDEIIQFGLALNDMLDTLEANNRKLVDYQKELEKKIHELSEKELESQRLTAQLQRAEKMEAIGTLAGGVAHDLNNILSGIVSYPELLLLDLPEDSPYRKTILTIKESGQKAATIVQDLLTLARRGVAVKDITNLNHLVTDYLSSPEHDKLKSLYCDIQFNVDLAADLFNIKGSPVHLIKTIMNLVSNAAESIYNQGEINIRTRNEYIDRPIKGYDDVEEGDYAVLTIEDTGSGISTTDLESIFEPFFTKKVMARSGTGLGMAVVWGTVKDHNGYIDIQSTERKGTTFSLYFPITRQDIPKTEASSSIEDYMGNGKSILIVDDVQRQREIASDMLAKLGYAVETAPGGEEAVEYLKKCPADLLVLDMIMTPGIDGLETYKKVLEISPNQKVIIASGYSETDRVKEAQRLGAGEYIKKPYTMEKIGLAVKKALCT